MLAIRVSICGIRDLGPLKEEELYTPLTIIGVFEILTNSLAAIRYLTRNYQYQFAFFTNLPHLAAQFG